MPPLITDFSAPATHAKGLVPRDWSKKPAGFYSWATPYPDDMLVDPVEWPERIAERKAKGSAMKKICYEMDTLDQDGRGDCWCFSTTGTVEAIRAWQNELYVPLCGTAIAWLQQPNSEGGFGGQSLDWVVRNGIPPQSLWPQGKTGHQYDTAECRAKAMLYRIERWWECDQDSDKGWHQIVSAILKYDLIAITDFNFWSHSVYTYDIVAPDESTIKNSWTKTWGDNGSGNLKGNHAKPNGAWIPAVVTPSET